MGRVLKAMSAAVAVIGFIIMTWSWQMWSVYYNDGVHRNPDKTAGRVFVDNMHGVALYTTRREHFILNDVFFLSFGFFVVSWLLYWAGETRPSNGERQDG